MHRKWILGGLLSACFAGAVAAQEFPQKTVRFIVPFPPGGATDGLARVLAEKMTEAWRQQVVIDNRAGAGGHIAAEIAAKAVLIAANEPPVVDLFGASVAALLSAHGHVDLLTHAASDNDGIATLTSVWRAA